MSFTQIDLIKIYKQKSALIIDDYPDMRGSIRRMLNNFGVDRVDVAHNGEDAIARCMETSYDIILADYNLGDNKSGQQILEELRHKELLKSTSLYMMITAETAKAMVFGALEYQPDDYLAKPFTQTVLQKRLDRMVLEKEALYEINRCMDLLNFDRAIELCQQRIALHDKYEQRCYRIMATCYYKRHKFQQARNIYQEIADERPVEWAQIGLGKCMMATNELDKAEKLFQRLINEGCLCLEVYDCLADIKTRQGDTESAQSILSKAVEISPNAIQRQEKLAKACENNKDWSRAEESHKKIIRLGRSSVYESPEQYFGLARCYGAELFNSQHKDKRRIKEAQEVLEKARKKYPSHENIGLQADIIEAGVFASADDVEASRSKVAEIQKRLETTANRSAQLMLDMARTYKSVGDHEKANALLRDLSERYAENETISDAIDALADEPMSKRGKQKAVELNNKGKELFASKNYQEAVSLFSQALKHYPNNIGLNLNLMLALVRLMLAEGATAPQLERCEEAQKKLSHLKSENPLYERYQSLNDNLRQLRASRQG